jgi:hypothetical protein
LTKSANVTTLIQLQATICARPWLSVSQCNRHLYLPVGCPSWKK